jgi:hypothetical protein
VKIDEFISESIIRFDFPVFCSIFDSLLLILGSVVLEVVEMIGGVDGRG